MKKEKRFKPYSHQKHWAGQGWLLRQRLALLWLAHALALEFCPLGRTDCMNLGPNRGLHRPPSINQLILGPILATLVCKAIRAPRAS
jgi:hypothetical protein